MSKRSPSPISVADACQQAGFSRQWFYVLARRGVLHPFRIGGRTFVLASEIEPLAKRRPAP